jgi:hypothetical protein
MLACELGYDPLMSIDVRLVSVRDLSMFGHMYF